jgi:hypothetical protein
MQKKSTLCFRYCPFFAILAAEAGSVAFVFEADAGCAAEHMSVQRNVESWFHLELIVKASF